MLKPHEDMYLICHRAVAVGEGVTMVKDPQLYRMIGSYPLADKSEGVDFCDHCKNPVYGRTRYGNNKELRDRAKRGWVVLTDRMYRVTGAAGERTVCAPCFTRGGFQADHE